MLKTLVSTVDTVQIHKKKNWDKNLSSFTGVEIQQQSTVRETLVSQHLGPSQFRSPPTYGPLEPLKHHGSMI